METQNKSPEVRFEGFTEEWGEIKFKKLFVGISNNSLSRDKLNYNIGKAKNIHYGDILIKFRDVVDVQKEIIPYVTEDEFVEKYRRSNLKDGDIIFADAAEDETVGKCVEIVNIQNDIVLAGLHTIAVRPQIDFASKYLGYYLNSKSYHNQLLKLMQGTKVLSISKNSIRDTVVYHPKKQQEQLLISKYFNIVDDLITNHQTQLTKLKNLKKAMLTKMFPQNGASVPEIRFKGFEGEWEAKTLGDLAVIVRGASPRPIKDPKWFDNSSNVGWLRISDVTAQDGKITHLNQRISEAGQEKTRVLETPHLLLSIAASVGKPVINFVKTGVHDGFLIFLKPEFEQNFMFQWMKMFEPKWQIYGQPGSQVNLNSDIVKNQKVLIPTLAEQKQIGTFFNNIDIQLENHNEQLQKLNNIKKACLNKLFVA